MSDKQSKAERDAAVRERLSDAIGNGQIHPALADYLALVDEELLGAADRHEQLLADLAADKDPEEQPEPATEPDESPATARKATPATVAKGGSVK
jgi:hypothetical protein